MSAGILKAGLERIMDIKNVKAHSMRLSILIATMNRPQAVEETLESIEQQVFLPQELIVVDQSKDPETKKVCDDYARRVSGRGQTVKYIHQEKPSLVQARNRGVSESNGDILCFIDDDVVLFPDYFQRIKFYFQDSSVGGVSGNIVMTGYSSSFFRGWKWEVRKLLHRLFLINNFNGKMTASTLGFPIYEREITQTTVVELFPGYSMNFRRELVVNNPCDEWFEGYAYREDVDLSYRISRSALLIMVPDARFIHKYATANRLDHEKLKNMQYKNLHYLYRKFRKYGFLTGILFGYSIMGFILLDLMDFLMNPTKKERWAAFAANFPALKQLFK